MSSRISQLNFINRLSRIIIGTGLIGFTMSASGPLGYLALLPLLAIYPVTTGMYGEDPIDGLVTNWMGGHRGHCFRPSSRVALIAVGAGAIGLVMASPQSLVSVSWLSLLSVYPIMAGLFGEDLFSVVIRGQAQVNSLPEMTHQPVVEVEHREASILHHGYDHKQSANHKVA